MGQPDNQRTLLAVLTKHFQNGTTFTRQQLLEETKWAESSLSAYESKMIGFLFEPLENGDLRVSEAFRRYSDWKDFKRLISQNKAPMLIEYAEQDPTRAVVFEFFLPLAHEVHLRDALDSLFYRDRMIMRLKITPIEKLKEHWSGSSQGDAYIEELATWIGSKFAGYSISNASGRYRAADFSSKDGAAEIERKGEKYLIDETTAIVRFIFPMKPEEKPEAVSYFFKIIFVDTVLEVIDKEAEIWVLESGAVNNLRVWRRKEKVPGERKRVARGKRIPRHSGKNSKS